MIINFNWVFYHPIALLILPLSRIPSYRQPQYPLPTIVRAPKSLNSMSTDAKKPTRQDTLHFEPTQIDSLDARAIQYRYSIVKLSLFIQALDRVIKEYSTPDNQGKHVLLVHYISFCVANLFSINENGFAPKIGALETYKIPKASAVPISAVVTHVPYDGKDYTVKALTELPPAGKSVLCLKALRAMCVNCLDGYQKRYTNASREIDNAPYFKDLDHIFENQLFSSACEMDLSLKSEFLSIPPLALSVDLSRLEDGDYAEACLIDMDVNALFSLVYNFSAILAELGSPIEEMRAVKLSTKTSQQSIFKNLPQKSYSLHKLLFWAIRLNDLYLISRKFVRQIYQSNLEHLSDKKFLAYIPNGQIFQNQLTDLHEFGFTAKKNGVLVATITRFVRTNSKHEVSSKSCLDFIGFIHQFFVYLGAFYEKLNTFGQSWLFGELAFRSEHNLFIDHLSKTLAALKRTSKTQLELKRQKQMETKEKEKEDLMVTRRKLPVAAAKVKTTVAPTNRITSPSSSDTKSEETQSRSPASSLSSAMSSSDDLPSIRRNSSLKERNPPTERLKKPLTLHRVSSTSSLPPEKPKSSVSPERANSIVGNRARSSSQPLSFGAANQALRGDDGNRKDKPDQTIANLRNRTFRASPLVVQQSENPAKVKLSASQKFQQHLQEATKSGALFGKEKESLTSVVFDPNNPSATNIKRSSKLYSKMPLEIPNVKKQNEQKKQVTVSSTSLSSSAAATASKSRVDETNGKASNAGSRLVPRTEVDMEEEHAASMTTQDNPESSPQTTPAAPPVAITRAQITRANTKRNSVAIKLKSQEDLSSSNQESNMSSLSTLSIATETLSMKKVRFSGVPEWTPSEDAPTSHSKRILRNFASFQFSSLAHTAFKQKDQLFKKEESISFRKQLNPSESAANKTLSASYSLGFSSFRSKIK